MTLDNVKQYLRVDGSDSDEEISSLMAAAESYIKQQTGKTKKIVDGSETGIANDELYILCVKLLVSHWYDNRGVEVAGNVSKISHSVDAMINHISMCGDYI